MAHTTGLRSARIASQQSGRVRKGQGEAEPSSSAMSLPAQKAFSPAPVMSTARTSARVLQSFTCATSASAISGVTAVSVSGGGGGGGGGGVRVQGLQRGQGRRGGQAVGQGVAHQRRRLGLERDVARVARPHDGLLE